MDWNDDGWFGLPSEAAECIYWVDDTEVVRLVMLSGSIYSRAAKRKHHRRRVKARRKA